MKYICLDTETTGFCSNSDKIIEIGCIDITDGLSNKKTWQQYINPNRIIPDDAIKIHGITNDFIKEYKSFKDYAQNFLDFIKDSALIIHNANFDIKFLNAELERNGFEKLTNKVIDTLKLAKSKFPGEKASLNALKEKFSINIQRINHGALLDAEILSYIYIELIKTQNKLDISQEIKENSIFPSKKIIEISQGELTKNNTFFEENTNAK